MHQYAIPGSFDVSLIITTANGCTDTLLIPDMINIQGPYGSFDFMPKEGCPDLTVTYTSIATANTSVYEWDMGDGTLLYGSSVMHTYTASGIFHPVMILYDNQGCQVLIEHPDSVNVYPVPTVDFSATQSILCDTGSVSFLDLTNSTVPISGWYWDFGDGGTSTQQNPTHFYGAPGSYDVKLILETSQGCMDSLSKPGYININQSPTAAIGLSDTAGCIPFGISFADLSPATNNPLVVWNWDFGDGNNSTQQFSAHSYLNPGTYTVSFQITDIYGCTGSTDTTVTAWGLPDVNFIANDSFGCAPTPITFTDLSSNSLSWVWDFGDGNTSNLQQPVHTYNQDGMYTVSLQVTDQNGCIGELTKPQYINLDHPEANFTVSDKVTCPGVDVVFMDLSESDTTIVDWQWDFGDGNTATGNPAIHAYANPGIYDVTLTVTDIFGCSHTLALPALIEVLLSFVPDPVDIRYVSIQNANTVQIDWGQYPNTLNDFAEYVVYRTDNSGAYQVIYTTNDITETQYIDADPSKNVEVRSYCYKVSVNNYCNLQTDLANLEAHCTIDITTSSMDDAIELSWTPYTGWPSVQEYRIYRVTNYIQQLGPPVQIGVVPGNVTMFTDSNVFCFQPVTYRIKAIQGSGNISSKSDIDTGTPGHSGPDKPVHAVTATVENNNFVRIEWDVPQGQELEEIIIERDGGNGFSEISRTSASQISFEDYNVNVNTQSYTYRISGLDSCGLLTPSGRIGKTILLEARREQGRILLGWSPYLKWENGVDYYSIEVFSDASGQFELVDMVPGNITDYEDTRLDIPQPINCYRIIAYENGGNGAQSVSNEACVVLEGVMYSPNAFSPNGDGINDRFLLKGTFIANFHMTIFNRWGRVIHESFDLEEGWNGTFNGQPAPEGVYVFMATGIDFTGAEYKAQGSVTLIR
jgi:gliding motility-associated-like protein